jgi:hypothetical protein
MIRITPLSWMQCLLPALGSEPVTAAVCSGAGGTKAVYRLAAFPCCSQCLRFSFLAFALHSVGWSGSHFESLALSQAAAALAALCAVPLMPRISLSQHRLTGRVCFPLGLALHWTKAVASACVSASFDSSWLLQLNLSDSSLVSFRCGKL